MGIQKEIIGLIKFVKKELAIKIFVISEPHAGHFIISSVSAMFYSYHITNYKSLEN